MVNKMIHIIYRILFFLALGLLFVSVWNKFIGLFGWTVSGVTYLPARLLELAALFMLFAIALLLREIRDFLQKKS